MTFSPDEPVVVMCLNQEIRTFVVGLTGAYVDPDLVLEGVRLELSEWTALCIQEHMEGGTLAAVEHLPAELADIYEFEMLNESVRLAGSLRRAHGWYELTFLNPKMTVEYVGERRVVLPLKA
ncbi:hypothetical protein [Deinococcus sp. QL22]|uniref:hypothetical protein n=1 Tax=Deinococcus sp. QL22 TaxID=2939437 RepID=UPI0020170882|nr:hypothetical protein [Deinococcus sp. QL22]UQN10685.1 hypothetical protein M1R55_30380 [Deinococcus sp. QL22]